MGKLSEREYDGIVTLIKFLLPNEKIEEITGRGHATIQRVKKTVKDGTGYKGYKEYIKYHYRKKDCDICSEDNLPAGYENLDDLLCDILKELVKIRDAFDQFIKSLPKGEEHD